jgi:hypothetical protein
MLDCPARRNTFVGPQALHTLPGSTPINNKVVAILIAAVTKLIIYRTFFLWISAALSMLYESS